jgi:uncharacterized protein YcnI
MRISLRQPAAAALLLGLSLVAVPASAHIVLQKFEAYAGYQDTVTVVVPHGCGLSPTIELRVKIPDGIFILVPEDKPGWQTRVKTRKLDKPLPGEGGLQITEVADEVTWTGGRLPPDQLGLFNMLVRLPNAPGRTLYFRTVQKCATGESRWIDTVPDGEPTWKVWATEHPSPFVQLRAAPGPQLGATMQEIAAERARRQGKVPPKP